MFCDFLQELEIDAANLVCFTYLGRKITSHMQNISRLVSGCFGFMDSRSTIIAIGKNQNGYFSQLQTLTLYTRQDRLNFSGLLQISFHQKLMVKIIVQHKLLCLL